MKNFNSYLPSGLLVAYIVYSAFIPVTIAHSFVVIALSGLFAYNLFLARQETSRIEELAQFKQNMEKELAQYKESCNARFSRIEDESAKMALNTLPSKIGSSSPSPAPRKASW